MGRHLMRGALSAAAGVLLLAALAGGADWSEDLPDIHKLVGESSGTASGLKPLAVFPERLVYEVKWGIIPVGEATLSADRVVDFAGRPAYAIVSEAVSNAFCDAFYKVRDLNESWIDARSLSSLGYAKQLREGSFYRNEWVLYDYPSQRFLSRTTHRDGNFSVRVGTIPASVQDVLSAMYFIRSHELKEGAEIILDVNTRENWPLVVRVIRRQKIKTPAGRFNAVLVEPALRKEGLFIQKGKKLEVWLTDDERKIPVLMRAEVFFGHITCSLSKML